MGRGRLTKEEVNILKNNPFVSDVNESRIIYTNEFKFYFMQEYISGRKPTEIFRGAGFDTEILGSKRIERAAQRWRESYKAGSLGSYKNGKCSQEENKEKADQVLIKQYLEIIDRQKEEISQLKEKLQILNNQNSI